jgi:hypothetical protein
MKSLLSQALITPRIFFYSRKKRRRRNKTFGAEGAVERERERERRGVGYAEGIRGVYKCC